MVAELSRVNSWIYSVLSGDAVLSAGVGDRIYSDEAPQGTPSPLVVFAYLGGNARVRTLKGGHLLTSLYMIRAIAEGSSYDDIEPLADRIDALLTVGDQGTVVRGVRITACHLDQAHQRRDASEGKPVVYMGGVYRIDFQPASQ